MKKEEYNKFLEEIIIESINLKYISAEKKENINKLENNKAIFVQVDYDTDKYKVNSDKLCVDVLFDIGAKDEFENSVFDIKFIYTLEYSLKEIDLLSIDDNIISKFIEKNIPVNVWPYAREIISSITTRMGYPAFIIRPYVG